MGDKFLEMLLSIFTVAAGVAIVALVLTRKSNTAGVIQAWFSGNSNLLAVATAPVTGTKVKTDLSYPAQSPFGDLSLSLN